MTYFTLTNTFFEFNCGVHEQALLAVVKYKKAASRPL